MYHYYGNWIIWTQWTRCDREWGEITGPATLVEYTTDKTWGKFWARILNRRLLEV